MKGRHEDGEAHEDTGGAEAPKEKLRMMRPAPPSASGVEATPARPAGTEGRERAARSERDGLAPVTGEVTLVTGASGFLGRHLVAELRRRWPGSPIRALQSGPAPSWLREPALAVEIRRGSVTSAADLASALGGVARVYHLAGMVSHRAEDARRMYEVHVEGTRLLCQAAAEAGVQRIVMASTSGTVAVSRRADADLDEESPTPVDIIGRWPYYTSKLYQEEVARRACRGRVELVSRESQLAARAGRRSAELDAARPAVPRA